MLQKNRPPCCCNFVIPDISFQSESSLVLFLISCLCLFSFSALHGLQLAVQFGPVFDSDTAAGSLRDPSRSTKPTRVGAAGLLTHTGPLSERHEGAENAVDVLRSVLDGEASLQLQRSFVVHNPEIRKRFQ